MVCDGDRDKGEREGLSQLFRREAPSAEHGHCPAEGQVYAQEQHREGDEAQRSRNHEALSTQLRQVRVKGDLEGRPQGGSQEPVEGHRGKQEEREHHLRRGHWLVLTETDGRRTYIPFSTGPI